jgi:hypothetical protein
MEELFESIDLVIWQELSNSENINSYKRELQNMQINLYSEMIHSKYKFPSDAVSLARNSLKKILKNIYSNLSISELDNYTQSHLENSSKKIQALLEAEIQIN